jgi:hypothetical protein
MLPDRGVLYFFHDLTWGQPDVFRVLYEEGGHEDWRTIEPPDDLGHPFGDQAKFVWQWAQSADDCPRVLPKWTLQPLALTIPRDVYDPQGRETPGAPFLWPGEKRMAEALRRAQGEDVPSNWFSVRDSIDEMERQARDGCFMQAEEFRRPNSARRSCRPGTGVHNLRGSGWT